VLIIAMTDYQLNDFAGVWIRTALYEPMTSNNLLEIGKTIIWLQTKCGIFIDIRIYLNNLSISTTKSFGGYLSYDSNNSHLVWTREVDFRPLGPPDIGKILFINNNTLQEDGVLPDDDYREIWERVCQTSNNDCACELSHKLDGHRKGYFIVVGEWMALTYNRQYNDINDQKLLEIFQTGSDCNIDSQIHKYALEYVTIVADTINGEIKYALDSNLIGKCLSDISISSIAIVFETFDWINIEGTPPPILKSIFHLYNI
jgi:hypothetical protein